MSTVTSLPALGNPVDGAIIARHDFPEALQKTRPASPGSSKSQEEKIENGGSSEDDDIVGVEETHALVGPFLVLRNLAHCVGFQVFVNDGKPFPVDPLMPVETSQLTVRLLLLQELREPS